MSEQKSKKPWKSKTVWINLILAVVAFIPAVAQHVTHEVLLQVFAFVNVVLRLMSKDELTLK
jgi:uncharacterized membrane protein YqaE (UPF0057 family)